MMTLPSHETVYSEVYFNLHKKVFSVRALEGENKGKVIAHMNIVLVELPKFVVQEGGRQRVIREKRKNVHAFVRGQVLLRYSRAGLPDLDEMIEVTYNPYKYDSFVTKNSNIPVKRASLALLTGKKVFTTRDAIV